MKVIVSACLLGENCKYSGGNNRNQKVIDYLRGREIIRVCPELAAGLGVPRKPVEIVNGALRSREGISVDEAVRKAVAQILDELAGEDIECAILQSRSPTCGVNQVYDGTFSGTLIPGSGILAEALREGGYRLMDAEDVP